MRLSLTIGMGLLYRTIERLSIIIFAQYNDFGGLHKMNIENLYTSHNLAIMIKSQAKVRKVSIKDMLVACNLGSNTMSALYHGKSIAFDSLAKIADYLGCSVDYLLGRTDNPRINK